MPLRDETHFFRQLAEIPVAHPLPLELRSRQRGESGPRLPAQLRLQRRPVAADRQHLPVGIHHLTAHPQMRRHGVGIPGVLGNPHPGHPLQVLGHRLGQRPRAGFHHLQQRLDVVRDRHEIPPQRLRQGFQQGRHPLRPQARHQPVQLLRIHLIHRRQRYGHGHAVVVRARREAIG
jgi:hypothetical protein